MINKIVASFFNALMLFTIVPVPESFAKQKVPLERAVSWFGVIGLVVGCVSAVFVWLGARFVDPRVGIVLGMASSVWFTRAIHEDGVSDFFDGFGGGWSDPERIMAIMKDSRVGAFGLAGLVFVLALKFSSLLALPVRDALFIIVAGHVVSRGMAASFVFSQDYVRPAQQSHFKPLMSGRMGWKGLLFLIVSSTPVFWFLNVKFCYALVPVLCLRLWLGAYLKKTINGYTGDCLGAVQQLCEVCFYLFCAGISKCGCF